MKVLVTGSSGLIGSMLIRSLADSFEFSGLDVRRSENAPDIPTSIADGSDLDAISPAFVGIDAVVHLAADAPVETPWPDVLKNNISTTHNVYEAARQNGVKRVVFASSNHAMGGYKDRCEPGTLTVELPPRPGAFFLVGVEECDSNAYGTSKLMGERIGRWYSIRHGLSVIALRIGWVRGGENRPDDVPEESEDWLKQMWLSNRDFCQLAECCIEADPNIRFEVVNAMSNNAGMPWDLEHTRKTVGYEPQGGGE